MRILISLLSATLLVAPLTQPALAKDVSVEFFYESLDPYGDWIQSADYGYVWHPKDVDEGWRPYTVGSWAYTDAGWTWLSDEPYGAITCHYGRWARLQDTGWVWVPDTEWAPAWVSWRRSDQYVGWAPLPPEATFKREVGISTWADSYYDIGPTQYSFVASRDFGQPKLSTVILPRKQNVTIIRETKNITNITYSDRGVFNEGPQYDIIVRDSRTPVRRLRLERREDVEYEGNRVRGDSMRANIVGDSLRVFAPAVGFRTEAKPTRVTRQVERVEVDRGWRDVPQAQEMRAHFQQDRPRVPASLPQQPSFTRAAAATGLIAPATRTNGNLDSEGRPRTGRDPKNPEGVAGERPKVSATEAAPAGRPDGNMPNNRKPATAEGKNPRDPQGRPLSTEGARPPGERPAGAPAATTEGATPDAPRPGRNVPLTKTPATPPATAREDNKPPSGVRPEGSARPEGAKPEGVKRPEGATRPGVDPEARPGRGPDVKPESPRVNKEARPETERPGPGPRGEPKVSTPGGDAPRARTEGAPDGPKRSGAVAPATRPAGAPATPEAKGKKGDHEKDKDKDKEKGQ